MNFRRVLGMAKGHIGRAYGHAVRFGGMFDKGVGFARSAYGMSSPMLKEAGIDTSHADKSVKQLGKSYDAALRSQVSRVHEAGKKIGGI